VCSQHRQRLTASSAMDVADLGTGFGATGRSSLPRGGEDGVEISRRLGKTLALCFGVDQIQRCVSYPLSYFVRPQTGTSAA